MSSMEQRRDSTVADRQSAGSRYLTRRGLLAGAGGAVVTSITGCTGGAVGANDRSGGQSPTIAILAAGSLQHALENGLKPAVDVPVQVEAHGSATVARLIEEGQRDPDIVTVADVGLFDEPLSPPWYSVFTSNAIVIAYNPETEGGKRLAEAGGDSWYEPMARGEVRIGRTDPDLDPLGYRTLFTLALASRYYDGASNLQDRILRQKQIYPETSLLSQFETGSIDAAFAYRNMAVERDYAYIDLPDQIDLSNPTYATDWYATVSHTLSNGQAVQGGVISYGSTIRRMSDAAVATFDVHTTGDYLDESGFLRREQFPLYEGDPPSTVADMTSQANARQSGDNPPLQSLAGTVSDITLLV